ncbi:hypothetical protein STEG23_005280 [Scotinomys teguina]
MCRLSWFLDPGGWSKTAAVRLYFIFPGICTLSLVQQSPSHRAADTFMAFYVLRIMMMDVGQKDSHMGDEAQSKRSILTMKYLIKQQHCHQLRRCGDDMAPYCLQQAACDPLGTPHAAHQGSPGL